MAHVVFRFPDDLDKAILDWSWYEKHGKPLVGLRTITRVIQSILGIEISDDIGTGPGRSTASGSKQDLTTPDGVQLTPKKSSEGLEQRNVTFPKGGTKKLSVADKKMLKNLVESNGEDLKPLNKSFDARQQARGRGAPSKAVQGTDPLAC